ncbi:MAG: class I SAM-dependent methyltransferase [Verrucomicrobiae bacterium]|nr:class I SAM-dependent methyltransferase [Verrucomicrobiae bacterium]
MNPPQQSNVAWWSANPMTYDWEKHIQAQEGSLEFFQESDRRALEAHRPFGHPAYPDEPAYSRLIPWPEVRDKRVLEIGCGMGLHASLHSAAGAKITTIDLTWRAVHTARRRFNLGNQRVNTLRTDGEKLPFRDNSFDRVWSWGVIHHSSNTAALVREIHRVLKPGGLFQFMVYHRHSVRYWIIGGVQHGILHGKLLRMNLEQVNQTFTDGAIARHYTAGEMPALLQGFTQPRCRILQETGSDAMPKISPLLRRLAPDFSRRFDQWVNDRWGWFLFVETNKEADSPA